MSYSSVDTFPQTLSIVPSDISDEIVAKEKKSWGDESVDFGGFTIVALFCKILLQAFVHSKLYPFGVVQILFMSNPCYKQKSYTTQ